MGGSRTFVLTLVVVVFAVGVVGVTAAAGTPDAPNVATPTVTGPVTGGKITPTLISTTFDLAEVGYVAEEFFVEGTATSFAASAPFGPDGKWKAEPAATAPYKTRIVVYRPAKVKDFDGTVFVEWFNVTPGFDLAADWVSAHAQLIDAGAAYVGVSVQSVGVEGGQQAPAGGPSGPLKVSDPERYGTLLHPGDAYSYDILSQAGLAAEGQTKLNPLGNLKPKRVIAMGWSQSALGLVTYVNAVHPLAHVYDGFLIHSRAKSGLELSPTDPAVPETAVTRSDVDVPVLTFQTENDLTQLGYLAATQKDSKRFRLWEVAGASHADAYATTGFGASDTGDGEAEQTVLDPTAGGLGPPVLNCAALINNGPGFAVLDAAVFQLERWVRDGTRPPKAPRLETTSDAEPTIVRDDHGNAKGGIRTPILDAPLAAITGEPNAAGAQACSQFGNTTPFDATTLAQLYPTKSAYVKQFNAAANKAVKAGFLLKKQAKHFKNAAASIELDLPAG
jgi:hypothetical protein